MVFKRELLLARASTDHCFLFFCFCHKIPDYNFQEYYGFQEYYAFQEIVLIFQEQFDASRVCNTDTV